jgi:glutamine amidotransferase
VIAADPSAPGLGTETGPRICLLNYGMGNLRSVEKALERLGAEVVLTSDVEVAATADAAILPGVGAFPKAMGRVRELGLDRFLADWARDGRPLLGICLGMQLLFERSSELGGSEGLGLLPGDVTALEAPGLKVPHMGWEPVRWERGSALAGDTPPETPYYFVHSYAARPADAADAVGTAVWGERFACAVERDATWGVQFHPEKSSQAGLALLARFLDACVPA